MKVGFIAVLGRPNVGKSTLVNALLSKKVSIVTPKAQTTRDAISAILTEKDMQMIFVDTPGIFIGTNALDKRLRKNALDASLDVNLILYIIDASVPSLDRDFDVISSIRSKAPKIFILNKIDLVLPTRGEELKAEIAAKFPDTRLIEASFLTNFGLKDVKEAVIPYLEEGEMFYPEDWYTDKDLAYQAKEVIREKMLHFLRQEIPHQSAVLIDRIEQKEKGLKIKATIVVENPRHQGIVIGKGGSMIASIRKASLSEMGRMWHLPIASLELEVETDPNWRNDPKKLARLGYGDI